jgi:hypothetical protein
MNLGRDRFARYAIDRLAGAAVQRLLYGHRVQADDEEGEEAALLRTASDNAWQFKTECGLRELGQEFNDILDVLRGGERSTGRSSRFAALRDGIVQAVQQYREGLEARRMADVVIGRLNERRLAFVEEELLKDQERARDWVVAVQRRILEATARLLGRIGAPATARVLDDATSELRNAVIPELRRDADKDRRVAGMLPERVHAIFSNYQSGTILPINPLVRQGAEQGVNALWHEAEANLQDLAADVIADLIENCMNPLREAVNRGHSALQTDARSTPDRPSSVSRWMQDHVPTDLEPAQNECLLESPSQFPSAFQRVLQVTCETGEPQSALSQAVLAVVTGSTARKDAAQTVIRVDAGWSPRSKVLSTLAGPQTAAFSVLLDATEVHERAAAWVRRDDAYIGQYVRTSLVDYLSGTKADPREHARRLAGFKDAFAQTLATSMPFVLVDPQALLRVHDRVSLAFQRVMTVVPFPKGHPARAVVTELLKLDGMEDAAIEKVFGDSDTSTVEVTTFLAGAYNPLVFGSLTGPIVSELTQKRNQPGGGGFWRWRRARPLPQFIPVSPEARQTLIRGWFTARVLNLIELPGPLPLAAPVRIWTADGVRSFPFPLLGRPVRRLDEVLPALLESLPLAMLDAAGLDGTAMDAYRRLAALGLLGRDGAVGDRLRVPDSLRDWLDTGSVEAGAPVPSIAASEQPTRGGRLRALEDFLQRYTDYYMELDQAEVASEAVGDLAGVWELRHEITAVLQELKDLCKRAHPTDLYMGEIG